MVDEDIRKWWDDNALDFQKEYKIGIDINYGPGSPNEDYMKLLGNVEGKNILEIGCGGAQCGIALAKKGAKVIGIDISEEQLKYARKLAKNNCVDLKLFCGNMENLGQIESNSQDIVFSSWALAYIGNLSSCFTEIHRVLKKGGIVVFSLNHPFWTIINSSTFRIRRSYFDVGPHREPWKKGIFTIYHHKMSDIINAIVGSHLVLEKVIEPDSRKEYKEDFWMENYEEEKKEAMKFVPRNLIIKAKKTDFTGRA